MPSHFLTDRLNLLACGKTLIYLVIFVFSELNTNERGKDEQVTVGWGSKETQFQGSIGKVFFNK